MAALSLGKKLPITTLDRGVCKLHSWFGFCEETSVSQLDSSLFVYTTTHRSLKAYCAIWVRRPNFRHQASARVTMREHPAAEGGSVGEKCPGILPKFRLPRYIQESFTCRKATTWDRWLYFPSEERRAEDFFALKIRRLRPDVNPRTWVPKASTLPLDHRSRSLQSAVLSVYWLRYLSSCIKITIYFTLTCPSYIRSQDEVSVPLLRHVTTSLLLF
jgi:hypothetical protein